MSLTLKLFIVNFIGSCVMVWAWWMGIFAMIAGADYYHITTAILVAFFAGVLYAFRRARAVERLPKVVSKAAQREGRKAAILNTPIADVAESLVLLGLIGSALGIVSAFFGTNQETLSTPEGMKEAGVHALSGVTLLAGATLAGSTTALWTIWNNRVLEIATALHNEDISS
jgi:hypothetical protein